MYIECTVYKKHLLHKTPYMNVHDAFINIIPNMSIKIDICIRSGYVMHMCRYMYI